MRKLNSAGVVSRPRRALGAAAVAGLAGLGLAQAALAADMDAADAAAPVATAPADSNEVAGVKIDAKKDKVSSSKYTANLRDTPQSITVISSETIAAQNLLSLREILSTQPGITFGAGEGGGGYGDSINIRGYSANNDITVDGVRDSAQYTRTDPFNLEQVEVIAGANSVYSGAGSLGGTINIVTKTPKNIDQTVIGAGGGTDHYGRLTIDTNKTLTDTIAVRLNVMAHRNDVPGRDVEKFKRFGIAPSIAFGLGTPTRVTLQYVHQKDDNIPQYGVPYYVNAIYKGPLPGVDPSNYYGYSNVDTQETKVDALTARFEHDFSEDFTIRNLTRYQEVTQFARVDPPQGTWCLANGQTPAGVACATPGFYTPSGPRGNTRDTKNKLFYSQTDFNFRFATGPVAHNLVAGFSIGDEDYHLDTGNSLRNPGGALPNPTLPLMSIANPNHVYAGPLNFVVTGRSDGQVNNKAVYLFDTAKLSEKFEFNFGVRYEKSEGEFVSTTIAAPYPVTGPVEVVSPIARNSDTLFSYRAGLVFKPVKNASIYIAYGNTQTPSQASVNGGCTATSTTGAANCNVDPEKGENIELGGKWETFEGRLLLTGAIFRNERTNYKVPSGDPTLPDAVLDGKSRVDGFSLGASGKITDKWSIFANYTYLDSEVIQSVSARTIANTGIDAQAGNPLTNTPKNSGSLWTTYQITPAISVGYGATYQGALFLNNGAPPLFKTQDYWVHNAMVAYRVSEHLDLQLNIKNIGDEEYYTRGRNNGWATPGDARSAILSANYRF
jgi:catecholate siderophore receptor